MRFRTSNPILYRVERNVIASENAVTYRSVAIKTIFLILLTAASGYFAVSNLEYFNYGYLIGAMIIGTIAVFVGLFSVRLAPFAAVIYALCEGIILGIVTLFFEIEYPGIAITAISTTLIVLFIMMLLYSTNIIKVDQRFGSFMVVAMISIIIMSIFMLIFGLLGSTSTSGLYIGVCVLSTIIAALYLFMDFEHIKQSVQQGVDTKYGWTLALGLMVSLVWLYIEILRLLAIFSRRRN